MPFPPGMVALIGGWSFAAFSLNRPTPCHVAPSPRRGDFGLAELDFRIARDGVGHQCVGASPAPAARTEVATREQEASRVNNVP